MTGTLDVLMAGCYGARQHDTLGRWIPDWSQEASDCDTYYGFNHGQVPPHKAGTALRVDLEIIGKGILLTGVVVDEVVAVVEKRIDISTFYDPASEPWVMWKEFAMEESAANPYHSPEGRYDSYWRTIMYDMDATGKRAKPELGEKFTEWSTGQGENKINVTGRIIFKHRRLFRTRRGFLGNGCSRVKAGDKVAVFHGARFPVVLREDEEITGVTAGLNGRSGEERTIRGHFLIGGDSYIHGLCDGEAFEIAKEEGIDVEQIGLL